MFPPGGAGFAGVPKVAPGGVYAADASSQTIGTTGANAAAQTAPGSPFTVEGDLRFPLESMRNTSMFGRENTGSYDGFWQNFGKMLLVFGSIGTDFCKKIGVLQHFPKSTRLSS